ncbi:cytochrome P450 [Nocardia fluminea]|uniref:cytochrome P450 n=1 Tax=Nocardia fluminea TaxID=134984 RepID=UPI003D139142
MLDSVDPETGERLDTVNIRNQILTFLVAGSETSANTIAFALHYLSTRPDIAASVRAELDPGYTLDVRETLALVPVGLRLRAHRFRR